MYSRDFGIRSEGQLYNMEREYNESRIKEDSPPEQCDSPPQKKGGLSFLRDLKLDDLIIIGLLLLLIVDSDGENDLFLVALAALLLL